MTRAQVSESLSTTCNRAGAFGLVCTDAMDRNPFLLELQEQWPTAHSIRITVSGP